MLKFNSNKKLEDHDAHKSTFNLQILMNAQYREAQTVMRMPLVRTLMEVLSVPVLLVFGEMAETASITVC